MHSRDPSSPDDPKRVLLFDEWTPNGADAPPTEDENTTATWLRSTSLGIPVQKPAPYAQAPAHDVSTTWDDAEQATRQHSAQAAASTLGQMSAAPTSAPTPIMDWDEDDSTTHTWSHQQLLMGLRSAAASHEHEMVAARVQGAVAPAPGAAQPQAGAQAGARAALVAAPRSAHAASAQTRSAQAASQPSSSAAPRSRVATQQGAAPSARPASRVRLPAIRSARPAAAEATPPDADAPSATPSATPQSQRPASRQLPPQQLPAARPAPSPTLPPARTAPSRTLPPARTAPAQTLPPARTAPSRTLPPARTAPAQTLPPARSAPSQLRVRADSQSRSDASPEHAQARFEASPEQPPSQFEASPEQSSFDASAEQPHSHSVSGFAPAQTSASLRARPAPSQTLPPARVSSELDSSQERPRAQPASRFAPSRTLPPAPLSHSELSEDDEQSWEAASESESPAFAATQASSQILPPPRERPELMSFAAQGPQLRAAAHPLLEPSLHADDNELAQLRSSGSRRWQLWLVIAFVVGCSASVYVASYLPLRSRLESELARSQASAEAHGRRMEALRAQFERERAELAQQLTAAHAATAAAAAAAAAEAAANPRVRKHAPVDDTNDDATPGASPSKHAWSEHAGAYTGGKLRGHSGAEASEGAAEPSAPAKPRRQNAGGDETVGADPLDGM